MKEIKISQSKKRLNHKLVDFLIKKLFPEIFTIILQILLILSFRFMVLITQRNRLCF